METIKITENERKLFKLVEAMYEALKKSKALVPVEDIDKIKTEFDEVIKMYKTDNPNPKP